MNTRIFVALTLLLATPELQSADTPDTADGASEWSWARMILVKRGRKYDRGIALYMTNEQSPGVAFRCQRDKLYAVVSVKPVDFNSLLTEWFRNPAEWKVEYRIDGEPLRAETWVWAYRGKVFVSPPGDSVKDLFEAARRGATLTFKRRKGDPISIDIPAGDSAIFKGFISKCGLTESYTA